MKSVKEGLCWWQSCVFCVIVEAQPEVTKCRSLETRPPFHTQTSAGLWRWVLQSCCWSDPSRMLTRPLSGPLDSGHSDGPFHRLVLPSAHRDPSRANSSGDERLSWRAGLYPSHCRRSPTDTGQGTNRFAGGCSSALGTWSCLAEMPRAGCNFPRSVKTQTANGNAESADKITLLVMASGVTKEVSVVPALGFVSVELWALVDTSVRKVKIVWSDRSV